MSAVKIKARFVKEVLDTLSENTRDIIMKGYSRGKETSGSGAIDLRYAGDTPLILAPGEQTLISTGLSVWLGDANYVGKIYPRSGSGSKGLVLGNLTGIIDSDYQGELKVCLWNRNDIDNTVECITIEPGERVAQFMVEYLPTVQYDFVDKYEEETDRGAGGFGHTGKL